jgi:glycosyltransferase involved in cell wall biosynthesis
MKILYHHRTQAEDAQGVHIYEMVNAFQELGHQVEMVALVQKDMERDEKSKGAAWEVIAKVVPNWFYELMELAYNLFGFVHLSLRIRRFHPDFIYERYSLNTFCGVWASKLFKVPILLEVNAPLYLEQKKLGKLTFERFARYSERWICSNATMTIVVSNVMKKIFMHQGVPVDKLVVMHNGVNPDRFQSSDRDEIREKYNLGDSVVIGFVGWFRKWHGIETLLEIFHEYDFISHNAKLFLVGDGPSLADLSDYIEKKSLQGHVILTGPVEKQAVAAHIAAMDVTVQPSATAYACPMKILEYMAMGKSIIATNQENIRELLKEGETARMFNAGDKDELATLLVELIQNEKQRQALGKRAQESIKERGFLWRVNAEKSIKLINAYLMADQQHQFQRNKN